MSIRSVTPHEAIDLIHAVKGNVSVGQVPRLSRDMSHDAFNVLRSDSCSFVIAELRSQLQECVPGGKGCEVQEVTEDQAVDFLPITERKPDLRLISA